MFLLFLFVFNYVYRHFAFLYVYAPMCAWHLQRPEDIGSSEAEARIKGKYDLPNMGADKLTVQEQWVLFAPEPSLFWCLLFIPPSTYAA